jgi:hypothetical protein
LIHTIRHQQLVLLCLIHTIFSPALFGTHHQQLVLRAWALIKVLCWSLTIKPVPCAALHVPRSKTDFTFQVPAESVTDRFPLLCRGALCSVRPPNTHSFIALDSPSFFSECVTQPNTLLAISRPGNTLSSSEIIMNSSTGYDDASTELSPFLPTLENVQAENVSQFFSGKMTLYVFQ